ncbi:cAMP-mediated signaling protein sok1, partial [Linderina macrospora]
RQALAQTLAHVLPSVNRYTLRELKIQNILQNPRLRHEVLFEPKLEFRPNTSGNMADAKQVATQQYWAAIEKAMSGWDPKSPRDDEFSMSTEPVDLSMVPVLLTEIREILAEMSEDAPNMTMARYAVELRERLDDERVRQQIDNDVFDPEPVV